MAMIIDTYPSARAFWSSRAIRLYPTYWLTIGIAVIALLAFHSNVVGTFVSARFWTSDVPLYAKAVWSLMVMSFTGLDLGQYICVSYTPFNLHYTADGSCGSRHYILGGEDLVPPAWTLSLEMYFYLLVPFIARLRDRNIAILALASFALAMWIAAAEQHKSLVSYAFPRRALFIPVGIAGFRWRHQIAGFFSALCCRLSAYRDLLSTSTRARPCQRQRTKRHPLCDLCLIYSCTVYVWRSPAIGARRRRSVYIPQSISRTS